MVTLTANYKKLKYTRFGCPPLG